MSSILEWTQKSKNKISFRELLLYVTNLIDPETLDIEVHESKKKISINSELTLITKIVLEKNRKVEKVFLILKSG